MLNKINNKIIKILLYIIIYFNIYINNIYANTNIFDSILSFFSTSKNSEEIEKNHWDYLKNQFTWHKQELDQENKKLVDSHLHYLTKHPNYMLQVSKQAEPYIYYISSEIKKRNLPFELVLIPLIESHFDPFAFSHANAVGIWQLTPITAKHLNLESNWWYDARRDIKSSTSAALNYLEELYKYYNNWLLALAAYNSGTRIINKAIIKNKKNNKPTDYWSLDLPRETTKYIPKILAFSKVINNPEIYNQKLIEIPNKPYFTNIHLESPIEFNTAAKLTDLTLDNIYKLNPGYNRFATAPDGPYRLLLPKDKAEEFSNKIKDKKYYIDYYRYKVKSGDNLINLAKKFNTTTNVIKNLNKLSSNQINTSQYLLIPPNNHHNNLQKKLRNSPNRKIYYKIKDGDTLSDIAAKYKLSINDIIKSNSKLNNKKFLKPGLKLALNINILEQYG